MATTLGDFESLYRRQQELGVFPSDQEIDAQLRRLAEKQKPG
jgi:hypothetical protein